MFFEIRHWEILGSFNIPPRIYFYEGALARLAYYNFTSYEPSRIPICKGNIVIVQLRLGRPSASPFKIYYMAYSARPDSLEYDMATQFKGKPFSYHDDVIKWKHFPGHWPFVRGIHRWFPHAKASDAELWYFLWSTPWINGWVNNREASDLRRHHAHYDVIVMTHTCPAGIQLCLNHLRNDVLWVKYIFSVSLIASNTVTFNNAIQFYSPVCKYE